MNEILYPIRHKQFGPDKQIGRRLRIKQSVKGHYRLSVIDDDAKTKQLWPINVKFDDVDSALAFALQELETFGCYVRRDEKVEA